MLKFWPSAPTGQLTPKAGPDGKERQNPFFSDLQQPPSPGHQTPTYHHHLLSTTVSHSPANISRVNADLTPTNPLTPGGAGGNNNLGFASALPTTHLSLHAPEFKMRPPPTSSRQPSPDASAASPSPAPAASGPTSTSSPPLAKGQIHVKLISARSLNVRSAEARPYVCVQFEQNEFVSREPTHEIEKVRDIKSPEKPKETTNTALTTNGSSSSALSALGAIAAKRGVNTPIHSPLAQPTSGKTTPGRNTPTTLFGPMSAHNPVWKHEVSLYVFCLCKSIVLAVQRCAVMLHLKNPSSLATSTMAPPRPMHSSERSRLNQSLSMITRLINGTSQSFGRSRCHSLIGSFNFFFNCWKRTPN